MPSISSFAVARCNTVMVPSPYRTAMVPAQLSTTQPATIQTEGADVIASINANCKY